MRNLLSLLVSILLHLIIFSLYFYTFEEKKSVESSKENKKISLQNVVIKEQNTPPNPIEKEPIKKEPIKKPKPPIVEEKIVETKKDIKPIEKIVQKNEERIAKIESTEQNKTKKPKTEEKKKIESISMKDIEESLVKNETEKSTPPTIKSIDDSIKKNEKIDDLYGSEFDEYSNEQKEFIKENLDDIGKITQSYLRYPRVAVETAQSGKNIVEFYLLPNGDIEELKLLRGSSYTLLDKNSIRTVEIAYKEYPRPKERTKIRINVFYRLY